MCLQFLLPYPSKVWLSALWMKFSFHVISLKYIIYNWERVSLLQLPSFLHWPNSGNYIYKSWNCSSALQPGCPLWCPDSSGTNLPPAATTTGFDQGASSRGHTPGSFYHSGASGHHLPQWPKIPGKRPLEVKCCLPSCFKLTSDTEAFLAVKSRIIRLMI